MIAAFRKRKVFRDRKTRESAHHIHRQIVNIGNAHAKHALQELRRKNSGKNHCHATAVSAHTRKQNGQEKPHRQKEEKIAADIGQQKQKAFSVPSRREIRDIANQCSVRINIGVHGKIRRDPKRTVRFPRKEQYPHQKCTIRKKESKKNFSHIILPSSPVHKREKPRFPFRHLYPCIYKALSHHTLTQNHSSKTNEIYKNS